MKLKIVPGTWQNINKCQLFIDPIIMIINFNVLCKICQTEKRKKRGKVLREGRQDKWKEEEGFISDLQLRGSASLLFEKAIQSCAMLLSKVD